ncbi:hypothetical protein AALP_AA6G294100 [Arabis alpina]|uniref:RRM domain-containing protein n=1 Tax=Arabis alpina TaxID=50452 RepID=A0A087GSJ2_ARAAL|nr:hypothetical protein AALP_AA6G294100 [Arabis alpina]
MAKEREDRKKEKKEKKRREAEELEVKEKKISKKHKSESKKPEKSKKKSKKSQVEEEKPHKKSKESKKKKHKRSDEEEESEDEAQTQIVRSDDSNPVTVPTATTNTNESDSDFEYDKEDIKYLLESYTKEELVKLIYKTAEKGSKLISTVLESAERNSAQRNIFVRGLGWDTTQENLKTGFEVYGEIEECSVVMDKDTGRAKGYGFVMFKTRKGTREALRNPEKRMYNRTVICSLAVAKSSGAGKPREPVESVKIDLTHTANQSEMALPGLDLAHGNGHGLDKGHQLQNMPMYGGQNMPFYGHFQPPGYNPMYAGLPNYPGAVMGGLPNYRMFGPGMMNQGPPNHMGMAGQYAGEGNGVGPGPGFDGERAWYLR